MRSSQLLLLLVIAFVACSSYVAAAESSVLIQSSEIDATRELATTEGRRSLRKSTELDAATEERVGATTPNIKQLLGFFRLPKFQSLGKLPALKQFNAIKRKFGEKVGKLYLMFVKSRYNANHQNFV